LVSFRALYIESIECCSEPDHLSGAHHQCYWDADLHVS
jgi:hypothetical protein